MTSDLLTGLNPQQREAVTTVEGPVLVLAGPGSGKTGVLTRRVAHLIRDIGVAPYQIMAVTFTNKAATEMRHRIDGFLGERVRGLQIGTFHSTCARILRIEAESTDYTKNYTIYDTEDQLKAIRQALEEEDLKPKEYPPRLILSRISDAKSNLILPENYFVTGEYETEVVKRIYPMYQGILKSSNAMDFDDLLMETVLLLQRNQIVREKYQQRYPFVMVDEFQDTNTVQYQLVQLFAKPQNNIFAVGDEDQSIYAFRGADYRNVMRFREDYPDARVILLEQNYRSTQVVLDTAHAVIDKNSNRTPKALFTDRKGGDLVTVNYETDEYREAEYVVRETQRLIKQKKYNYNDIAIMYRITALSRPIEKLCIDYNIPYRLVGAVGFYARREIKDLISFLKIINNPEDLISLERIILMQKGIGKKTWRDFRSWINRSNLTVLEAFNILIKNGEVPLKRRVNKLFTEFSENYFRWLELNKVGSIIELLDTLRMDVGYTSLLEKYSETEQQFQEREDNVSALRGEIKKYDESEISLAEYLQDQQLMIDADQDVPSTDAVTLLTLHAAKGLEYPVVFIMGVEDQIIPNIRVLEETGSEGLEEERRLMYVGITRAKDKLYLTHAFARSFFGEDGKPTEASRFLKDIPQKLMTNDSSILGSHNNTGYRRMTTWEARKKPSEPSRLERDLKKADKKSGHVSDETLRSKIIPFPGGEVKNDPLKYKTGDKVHHPAFGVGTVIDSKRVDGKEIVDVAFENKKFGIKKLDTEFAQMTIL